MKNWLLGLHRPALLWVSCLAILFVWILPSEWSGATARWVAAQKRVWEMHGTGFAQGEVLGQIAEGTRGDQIVFVVQSKSPLPQHYAGQRLDEYRSGAWKVGTPWSDAKIESAQARRLEYRDVEGSDLLFSPAGAQILGENLQRGAGGLWTGGDSVQMVWASAQGEVDRPHLNHLKYPKDLARILEQFWLRAAPQGAHYPFAWANKGQQFLQREFRYDLQPQIATGADPIRFFLEEGHRGYCAYFASALALALRAKGIPARLVDGYASERWGAIPDVDGMYRDTIYKRNAHAWVEFWDVDRWREIDPTPLSLERVGRRNWEKRWQQMVVFLDQNWPWGLLVLGVFGLLSWRRLHKSGRVHVPLGAEWQDLSKELARHGVHSEPAETIESLLARLPQDAGELAQKLREYRSKRWQ